MTVLCFKHLKLYTASTFMMIFIYFWNLRNAGV